MMKTSGGLVKAEVITTCSRVLSERIHSLKQQLHELVEGAKNDSKSTAGDKHETARAMMQIEQEKLSNQLSLLLQQEQVLKRIDPQVKNESVANGSLVKTNQGWICLSIPLGKITVNGESVMCLSAQSPLGQKLLGRKALDRVSVNGTEFVLESVG
jgi:transcription elongation GreA/GreB family factor